MVSVNLNNNNHTPLEFCILLEQSLKKDSDELEEIHMEAAIDAGFAELDIDNDTDNDNNNENKSTINKNSVQNCLSPYVPTNAQKIISFFEFVGLLPSDKVISNKDNPTTTAEGNVPPEIDTRQQHCINQNDILLDIGCGDGRICIAASQLNLVKKAIGIDISPPCITMAKSTQQLYNIDTNQCIFYRYDITKFLVHIINDQNIHKDQNKQQQQSIIKSSIDEHNNNKIDDTNISHLQSDVMSATIIFLYTYPTLLYQLIPLLIYLMKYGKLRSIITLTYHLPILSDIEVYHIDNVNDFQWYRMTTTQNKT